MYFVAECTTAVAPRARGCWSSGVAKVLSTTETTPAFFAASRIDGRSAMPNVGSSATRATTGRCPRGRQYVVGVHHIDGAYGEPTFFGQSFQQTAVPA